MQTGHTELTPLFFWLLPAAGTRSTRPGLSQQGQEWGWGAGPEEGSNERHVGASWGANRGTSKAVLLEEL